MRRCGASLRHEGRHHAERGSLRHVPASRGDAGCGVGWAEKNGDRA